VSENRSEAILWIVLQSPCRCSTPLRPACRQCLKRLIRHMSLKIPWSQVTERRHRLVSTCLLTGTFCLGPSDISGTPWRTRRDPGKWAAQWIAALQCLRDKPPRTSHALARALRFSLLDARLCWDTTWSMLRGFLNSSRSFRTLSDFINGNQRMNGLPDIFL
jgi:hypothetical protein